MKKLILLFLILCIGILSVSCGAESPVNTPMPDYRPAELPEKYSPIQQNGFLSTEETDSQAFSLKVDTAAYSNVARYLNQGSIPPVDAMRTEELLNYFNYDAPMPPPGEHPFSITGMTAASPFSDGRYFAYVRVKTPEIDKSDLPASNLTFLIDTSGSMYSFDKLPLLQRAFSLLTENLTEADTISIVTYAGDSRVLLDSVPGNEKTSILSAINSLEAGGSTAGAQGIQTAYMLAAKNYDENKNNRVILATDGDFNVGISQVDDLKSFISEKRDNGIYLSVLGFGTGPLRDDIMETLAANGNGNYSYIDTLFTAQKVLVEEMGSNLFTIAKNVKAQISFNKACVKEFRLCGYENRKMSENDFYYNKEKDAGVIGAGTDIVVLVELILQENYEAGNLFDVCIRYTESNSKSRKEAVLSVEGITEAPNSDFRFACAVAGFCELLRKSDYGKGLSAENILQLAEENLGRDEKRYRKQFLELINAYITISKNQSSAV